MDHVISIAPDGTLRTLYTEKIDLRDFGTLHVERASNVEYDVEAQGWTVQFADGTYIGEDKTRKITGCCGIHMTRVQFAARAVFDTREEALRFEVDFLQARL